MVPLAERKGTGPAPWKRRRDRSALASRAAGGETMLDAGSGEHRCIREDAPSNPELDGPWPHAVAGRWPDVNHVRLVAPSPRANKARRRPQSHIRVRPFAAGRIYINTDSSHIFLEENFTVTGTKKFSGRYPRQVGVRPGLSKGFSTHGRIFPVARRLCCIRALDPLALRGRGFVMIRRVPSRQAGRRPAHPEFPSATSWLTSRRSRRRHGVAMTTPLRP